MEIASRQLRAWLQGRRVVSAPREVPVIRPDAGAVRGLAGHRLTAHIERFRQVDAVSFDAARDSSPTWG